MALSPDVIFELFLPAEPPADQKAQIVGFVQGGLPVPIQQPVPPVWNPDKNVLTIGFWIVTDGFTQDQLEASLRASSFISPLDKMTVGLFNSTAYILLAAAENLKLPKKIGEHPGFIILNNVNVEVSSAGIVTTIFGEYHPSDVDVFPKVVFTYTISDTLALNHSGEGGPPLKYNESTHLQLDTIGVIEEAVLASMLNPFLGGGVFFGGLLGGGLFDPNAKGVGAQLADGWPGTVLTSTLPPLSGKLIFDWRKLNVDNSGVRTLGGWSFGVRSPQVRIVGPTAASFKEGEVGRVSYTVNFTDLRDGVTVVWGGDAEGGGLTTTVQIETPGLLSIRVTVTDVDNMSATSAMNVTVTEKKGHGEPP